LILISIGHIRYKKRRELMKITKDVLLEKLTKIKDIDSYVEGYEKASCFLLDYINDGEIAENFKNTVNKIYK